jgi:AAA15 family ATPase/GTPase
MAFCVFYQQRIEKPDFIQFIAQGTRPNKLFITEAFDKNVDIIKDVIHWFREHLQIIRSNSQYNLLTLRAYHENEFIKYLSEFLKIADTGINAIKCEKEEIDPDRHLTFFPDDVRDQILEDINQGKNILLRTPNSLLSIIKAENGEGKTASFIQLKTEHLRKDGEPILFKISDESDGTRRLLDLAPMLLDIWERDRVFVIDELDRSLHTHLSRLFIKMCIAGVKEKQARGQFIMTTHDTNLLDRSMLRRDEIVLMEKDQYGSSHITSLAEYKVTEGLNYENGYLNGRFGAIPFIGDIKSLLG